MGVLYVVGMGPGARGAMTQDAIAAIEASDLLCGYTAYIDLIKDDYPDKAILTTPMRQEVERCEKALQAANADRTVAMICSGDAGIYGMAGLIYELAPKYPHVDIVVVPGVTAATSGAAVLGAPLMNDFCVISLSDLLTPWDVIEKRLHGAGAGDFAVALYNPMSHKRTEHLRRACDILLQYRDPQTVCGWVENIGRDGCSYKLMTLNELRDETVSMFTTVFIGNSQTQNINGKMITIRGYQQ